MDDVTITRYGPWVEYHNRRSASPDENEAMRAEDETEVPCAGCGRLRKGRGLYCRGCRWNGRVDPEDEAA